MIVDKPDFFKLCSYTCAIVALFLLILAFRCLTLSLSSDIWYLWLLASLLAFGVFIWFMSFAFSWFWMWIFT